MNLVATHNALPAMSRSAVAKVRRLEQAMAKLPQIEMPTHHTIHGGCYTRTVMIPAGAAITGVLIKIPTTLIVSGDCTVFIGGETVELRGYNVLTGSAGRKQAFVAHTDTWLTMVFPTSADTVTDAEQQFTDEYRLLMSNTNDNTIIITGE